MSLYSTLKWCHLGPSFVGVHISCHVSEYVSTQWGSSTVASLLCSIFISATNFNNVYSYFSLRMKLYILMIYLLVVICWGTMLQARRLRVWFLMRPLYIFNSPNPSSHTMALGFIQLLTEMSTMNLPGVQSVTSA
jgi:hypothetical protein